MRTMDLEVTSEFLVIAATLIQLKARRLLPGDGTVDLDEDLLLAEERDRLLARLLANLTFKDVATVLGLRLEATECSYPETLVSIRCDPATASAADRREPVRATRIAERVLTRVGEELISTTSISSCRRSRTPSQSLRRRLDAEIETDFDRITAHLQRPIELVAYFLAVLELARWGLVEARQADHRAPIVLRRTASAAGSLLSEWDV